MLKKAFLFYQEAQTIYDVQSPYLFSLISNLNSRKNYKSAKIEKIENLRLKLLGNNQIVHGTDYGAGSRNKLNDKTVHSIISTSSSNKKSGFLLYNAVKFCQAKTILELGTNMGIGTSYLAMANEEATVHTIEGNEEISTFAKNNFTYLGLKNIHLYTGPFSSIIPKLTVSDIDLVFLDGHHDGRATIAYIQMIRPALAEKCLIILDDIYWSSDMTEAFHHLIQQPFVHSYLDLFHKGILIINQDLEHTPGLKYLPFKYKPWRIGIWGGK